MERRIPSAIFGNTSPSSRAVPPQPGLRPLLRARRITGTTATESAAFFGTRSALHFSLAMKCTPRHAQTHCVDSTIEALCRHSDDPLGHGFGLRRVTEVCTGVRRGSPFGERRADARRRFSRLRGREGVSFLSSRSRAQRAIGPSMILDDANGAPASFPLEHEGDDRLEDRSEHVPLVAVRARPRIVVLRAAPFALHGTVGLLLDRRLLGLVAQLRLA